MAKSRDKLYLEDGVSEADIDRTIKDLKLESDNEFCAIMRDSDREITDAFKKSE